MITIPHAKAIRDSKRRGIGIGTGVPVRGSSEDCVEVGLGKGAAGEQRLHQGVMRLALRQGCHALAAPRRLEDSLALADDFEN
jgi:hypothetical protein